jgi:hypothetical protein
MSHNQRVEFRPPKNWQPPESVEPGNDFDMVCSFRSTPDGSLCMTMLGDTKMPGYDDKDEHPNQQSNEYAKGLMGTEIAQPIKGG